MMAEVTPEKQSEYNSRYYAKNKERIRKERAERYKTDPEYRESIRRAALERKKKQSLKKKAAAGGKVPKRGPIQPTVHTVQVGDRTVEVMMYSTGQLARRLGRKNQTIRLWEKKDILPQAMYRSQSGDRLYTELQVKGLYKAYMDAVRAFGELARTRISRTSFPRDAKALWEEYPIGIDPAE